MAMLLTIALTIFIAEMFLPQIVPVPGIKPGLANIVTLVCLVWLSKGETFIILILRIVLGSVFSGGMSAMLYSLAGGVLCFIAEAAVMRFFKKERLWAVSVVGAVFHNIGQLGAAALILRSAQVVFYLPILIVSAVVTGAFTGICAQLAVKRIG